MMMKLESSKCVYPQTDKPC